MPRPPVVRCLSSPAVARRAHTKQHPLQRYLYRLGRPPFISWPVANASTRTFSQSRNAAGLDSITSTARQQTTDASGSPLLATSWSNQSSTSSCSKQHLTKPVQHKEHDPYACITTYAPGQYDLDSSSKPATCRPARLPAPCTLQMHHLAHLQLFTYPCTSPMPTCHNYQSSSRRSPYISHVRLTE